MASSSADLSDGGFATIAAMVVSLAVATVAGATVLLAASQLHAAREHLHRTQLAYALDGAQLSALATTGRAQGERLTWRITTPAGEVTMLAEPEIGKLDLASAATKLSVEQMKRMGVADADRLRARLADLDAGMRGAADFRELDVAPRWRSCARSLVSPWGGKSPKPAFRAEAPQVGGAARSGETWRIVASSGAWSDERTVTLTGQPDRPAILREFKPLHRVQGPLQCDDLFDAAQMPKMAATL